MAISGINISLGFTAPYFKLWDSISETFLTLEKLKSHKATLIMFICNHCPYVKHVNAELVRLAGEYIPKGISFIAINSNDSVQYPEDSLSKMKEYAEKLQYPFPYLYDETQEVAREYNAVCTPEFYLFDGKLACIYHGQFDDSRPSNSIPVTGKDIRNALEAVLTGKEVSKNQLPGIGCSIKWK
jgi:thiol-disulfide isomerase/thioredoxin